MSEPCFQMENEAEQREPEGATQEDFTINNKDFF